MKTNTYHNVFLTFLGILFMYSSVLAADAKIYDGYVILNNGEKLTGKIEMLSPSLNEVKVKLINDNELRYLKARDVKEYGFDVKRWNHKTKKHSVRSVIYVRQKVERSPIAFGSKEVLLEREVAGSINMYNHFIEQNTSVQKPYIHIIYIQKGNDGKLISITKANYKKTLKKMVANYPELKAKIGSRGHGYSKLTNILRAYNAWTQENEEETVGI